MRSLAVYKLPLTGKARLLAAFVTTWLFCSFNLVHSATLVAQNAKPDCCQTSETIKNSPSKSVGHDHGNGADACCSPADASADAGSATNSNQTTDISALLHNNAQTGHFYSLPANYVWHWWRNLRSPEYCLMVLCNGSCAYRGQTGHSACSLLPLFPLLNGSKLMLNSGCDM